MNILHVERARGSKSCASWVESRLEAVKYEHPGSRPCRTLQTMNVLDREAGLEAVNFERSGSRGQAGDCRL